MNESILLQEQVLIQRVSFRDKSGMCGFTSFRYGWPFNNYGSGGKYSLLRGYGDRGFQRFSCVTHDPVGSHMLDSWFNFDCVRQLLW